MATKAVSVQVANSQDLETMTMQYIAQGFTVMNKTPAQVTLFKKKPFPMVWFIVDLALILLFGFGILLVIITLIIYAADSDRMVTITAANIAAPAYTAPLAQPYSGQLAQQSYSGPIAQQSYSGPIAQQSYSGPIAQQSYSGPIAQAGTPSQALSQPTAQVTSDSQWLTAPRSPDGYYWWDGQAWQPVPQSGQLDVAQ
jgi:hypothetical protein